MSQWGRAESAWAAVQTATGQTVTVADVDQGSTGKRPRQAAAEHGIELAVVRLPTAKRGFVLLPRAGSWSGISGG